jgi:hypothetical protein
MALEQPILLALSISAHKCAEILDAARMFSPNSAGGVFERAGRI